jgi:hypothetical protein
MAQLGTGPRPTSVTNPELVARALNLTPPNVTPLSAARTVSNVPAATHHG